MVEYPLQLSGITSHLQACCDVFRIQSPAGNIDFAGLYSSVEPLILQLVVFVSPAAVFPRNLKTKNQLRTRHAPAHGDSRLLLVRLARRGGRAIHD
jgi:hypothetical protein